MPGRAVPRQFQVLAFLLGFRIKKADLGMAYVCRAIRCTRCRLMSCYRRPVWHSFSPHRCQSGWPEIPSHRVVHVGRSKPSFADQCLMYSMPMQFVLVHNNKGVAADLMLLVAKYTRLWTHRPMADTMKRRLARFVSQQEFAKESNFFFQEWRRCFTKVSDARDLTDTQIASKVMMVSNHRKLMACVHMGSCVARALCVHRKADVT